MRPHGGPKRKIVEYLTLGVVGRVIRREDYDIGRTSRSYVLFNSFLNSHDLAANMRIVVDDFPEPPAFISRLPLPMGVSMPPLMTIRYSRSRDIPG